jgi:hypothetical protein
MRHLIAFSILLGCASAHATPLTPELKTELAEGTRNSCLSSRARDPSSKNLTIAILQDYCGCYANGFADSMQTEDLEKNKENLTPETTKMLEAISQKCVASVTKK